MTKTITNKNRHKISKRIFFILILVLMFFSISNTNVFATHGINKQLSYQGVLKYLNGKTVSDGSYDIVFKIYENSTGGDPIWTGSHTTANGNPVEVKSGNFGVMLGSGLGNEMTIDFVEDEYHIGVTVGSDSEMSPRQRLGSSAYSFNSDAVDGSSVFKVTESPEGTQAGSMGDIALDTANNKLYIKSSGNETDTGWAEVGYMADSSVTTDKLADGAVTSQKILDGTILTTDLDDGSITTIKISDGNVTEVKIADGAITAIKLSDSSVTGAKIVDGTITTQDLADNSITTSKVTDLNITTDKIADSAITAIKLADGSVTSAKISNETIVTLDIADDAITNAKLADNSVNTLEIADGAVTSAKISTDAITTAKILNGTIATDDLADALIVTLKLADSAVTAIKIADANVTNVKLAASSVTTDKISDGTIVAADIADSAITTSKVSDLNITTAKIADAAILTAKLADNSVIAAKIADGEISTAKLAADSVTTAKILNGTITNDDINASAAIAWTKIDKTGSKLTDIADVPAYAGNAGKTLAVNGTADGLEWVNGLTTALSDGQIWIGNASDTATARTIDGDVTISNAGVVTIGSGAVTSSKILDGTIATTDLSDGLVTTIKIADGNVTEVKIADGAITTAKISDASVTSAKIVDGTVTTQDLADNSIIASKVADLNITATKLADSSVLTAKLADGSVSSAKIADGTIVAVDIAEGAIINAKLAADAVTTDKILDGTIAAADLGDNIIATSKIADDAITTAKVLNANITTAKLADNSVTLAKLANCAGDGQIIKYYAVDPDGAGALVAGWNCATDADTMYAAGTGIDVAGTVISVADNGIATAKLADGSVTTVKLADNAVATAKILDSAITAAKIADGSVTTVKLAADAVTTAKILDGTIATADLADAVIATVKLADSSVTSLKIADLNVTTDKIADSAILTAKLADNSIVAAKIADGEISTAKLAADSVTTAKILNGTITNNDINASAAIAWTKLDKTGSKLSDLDAPVYTGNSGKTLAVNGTADGLEWISTLTTSLASGNILVGNASNIAASVTMSGDATIDNAGALTIGNDKITSSKILDGTILTTDLADGLVTTIKISDGNVTEVKIADGAITLDKLATNSISSAKIVDGTIITQDLADNSITTSKVTDLNITNAKLADGAVTTDKILDGTIATADVADNAVTNAKMADNSVNSSEIVDGAVLTAKLADGSVTSAKITDDTIVNADIGALANIALSKLAGGSNIVTSLSTPSGSSASGGSIANNILTLSLANATNPGIVSISAQTFAGDKTFSGALVVNGNTTFGDVSSDALVFNTATLSTPNNLNIDSSTLFIDAANNRVGIGTTSPESDLHIAGNGLFRTSSDSSWFGSMLTLQRSRGTEVSPAAVQDGNGLGLIGFSGYDSSSYSGSSVIISYASENWTTAANGSELAFYVTPNGQTGIQEAFRIDNAGKVGIGTATPSAALDIANAGSGLSFNVQGAVAFKRGSDFSTAGMVNDADFGNTSLVRLAGSSAQTITGIASGADGKILTIINAGLNIATLVNQSTSSSAVSRIITGTGNDLFIYPDATVILTYDSGASRWRVLGGSSGGGAEATAAQAVTADTTLTAWGKTVKVDAGSSNVTITLPAPANFTGQTITVVKTDNSSNVVRVVTPSGSIGNTSGQTSLYLYSRDESVMLRSDGTNVQIAADNRGSVGQGKSYMEAKMSNQTVPIITMTSNNAPSPYVTSASSEYNATYAAWRAFQRSAGGGSNNEWATASAISNFWAKIDMNSAYLATAAIMRCRSSNECPSNWRIEGSNDNSVWTTLYSNSGTMSTTATTVNFTASGTYRYYRMYSVSGTGTNPGLAEFTLLGAVQNDHVLYNSVVGSYGSDIALDTTATVYTQSNNTASLGRFTLKGGKTYRLTAYIPYVVFAANTGQIDYAWYNADTGAALSQISTYGADGAGGTSDARGNSYVETILTPSSDTRVEARITSASSNPVLGFGTTYNPTAYIEVISTPQNTVNTVDFQQANLSGDQILAPGTNVTTMVSDGAGNITISGGEITLLAGKTYQITTAVRFSSFSGFGSAVGRFGWTKTPGVDGGHITGSVINFNQSGGFTNGDKTWTFIYTPVSNEMIRMRMDSVGSNLTSVVLESANSKITVKQIGSTAQTGLPLNMLIDAAASGTLNAQNFAQTWNWNTATTQTGLTLNLPTLTTGSGLAITSASASLNSTNGLLYVANTSASTNGIVARIQSNSAAGSGLTVNGKGQVGIGVSSFSNSSTDYGLNFGNATVDRSSVSGQTILKYETTGNSTFTPPEGVTSVQILVVGGGGGGGAGLYRGDVTGRPGGAGGGGGYRYIASQSVTSGTAYSVTVGGGGAGATGNADTVAGVGGSPGGNSAFDSIAAAGGGGGGGHYGVLQASWDVPPDTGGSGGGASNGSASGGAGNTPATTPSQGNNGGAGSTVNGGGGGGGIGGAGVNATTAGGGAGGAGTASTISGASATYAAGGGGSGYNTASTGGSGTAGVSGSGGSGTGAGRIGTAGTASRGGGGGGSTAGGSGGPNYTTTPSPGGTGGSGVVIVRFATQYSSNIPLEVAGIADGGVARFSDVNGYCIIDPTNTALLCSSDASLKKNVTPMNSALQNILALNPVEFNWNKEGDGVAKHQGFIAQEVKEIFPELVSGEDGNMSLNYTGLVPILVKAMQEQQARLDRLSGTKSQLEEQGVEASADSQTFQDTEDVGLKIDALEERIGLLDTIADGLELKLDMLATFEEDGSLTFDKDITFKGRVTFEHPIAQSRDSAGYAIVPAGKNKAEVKFEEPYEETPIVTISLRSAVDLDWYRVTDESKEGFTIEIEPSKAEDIEFTWTAISIYLDTKTKQ